MHFFAIATTVPSAIIFSLWVWVTTTKTMGFQSRAALTILVVAIINAVLILGTYHSIYEQETVGNSHQKELLETFKRSPSKQQQKWATTSLEQQWKQAAIGRSSIPVFYNLFVANASETTRVMDIVSEQQALLRPEHKPFFIQSIGAIAPNIPNATLLGHRAKGTEMVTLHSLWDFCTHHTQVEKVVYLHSKGSSRHSAQNEALRKFLTAGALSNECASVGPDMCNVCSSRFSPIPHPHTSGNMWLARCDYVRKLIDPFDFEERMNEFTTNCTANGRESCDGRLRYSAEHWIHSHPSVKVQ
jgi:hypothetical protein